MVRVRVVGVTLRVVGYIVKERDEKKTSETLRRVSLYQKSALYGFRPLLCRQVPPLKSKDVKYGFGTPSRTAVVLR